MNYRAFMVVCLLLAAVAFAPASAQKPNKNVVVESVDEDVVEGDAPAVTTDKGVVKEPSADKNAVKKDSASAVDKKSAVADKKNATDSSAASRKEPPVKKELDLDALLGASDEDDLLVEEKKAVVPAAVVIDSASADTSAKKSGEFVGDEKTPASDSAAQAVQGRRGGRPSAPKAAAKIDTAALGPLVIEDGRSINFAHNLKEYRSPRIAMLLSLLVPGLGQAYARSYVKAGAFGAAELATIGVAVWLNYKGTNEYNKAKKFADEYYDVDKMKAYDNALWNEFQRRGLVDSIWTNIDSIKANTVGFPEYYDTSFYNAAKGKESYFYESIRDRYFTPGWKDNEPLLDEVLKLSESGAGTDTITVKSGKYVLSYDVEQEQYSRYFYLLTRIVDNSVREERIPGYSSNQGKYNRMMDESRSYYDKVNYTWYVLIVNHIASAIDAGFTARAYNAKLLGQESVWNRLSVEQTYVYTGSEMSPGLAVRWKF